MTGIAFYLHSFPYISQKVNRESDYFTLGIFLTLAKKCKIMKDEAIKRNGYFLEDWKEKNMQQVELYTRKEAALYLGVTADTLRVWAHLKRYKLPYRKIGRKVQYLKEDLDQFIKNRIKGI